MQEGTVDPNVPEEIPVHNTFIQFGLEPEADAFDRRHLATAPAWVGPTMQSAMQAATFGALAEAGAHGEPGPQQLPTSGGPDALQAESDEVAEQRLGSPKMRCSAAPGFPGASGGEDGEEGKNAPNPPGFVPGVPPDGLPSMGSMKHAENLCKRCCFFPKGRCLNGLNCEFCHLEHEKRKRKKKKKGSKEHRRVRE